MLRSCSLAICSEMASRAFFAAKCASSEEMIRVTPMMLAVMTPMPSARAALPMPSPDAAPRQKLPGSNSAAAMPV